MSTRDWSRRTHQIESEVQTITAELPSLLANKDLTQDDAHAAYDTLDRLSEEAAVMLDEMDADNAPDDTIKAAEALRAKVEELRETINGKHYRTAKYHRAPR